VATPNECEQALHTLAERLAAADDGHRRNAVDRTLSCTLPDLGLAFTGRLADGQLVDIAQSESADAQIALTLTSDDLVALVDGRLKMSSAWASGRVKIDAGVRDLMRLRSLF
jgi:predicted lipid carrier protein YhbT